jgi:beta propeller repeat protein
MQLTDFRVEGPQSPRVGDTLIASFSLRNFGQYPLALTDRGVFCEARDPVANERSFGFTAQGQVLQPWSTIDFQGSIQLDVQGQWNIWPSYEIWVSGAMGEYRAGGPPNWHEFQANVGPMLAPDLVPASLSTSPAIVVVGTSTIVSVTVANIGALDSPACDGALVSGNDVQTVRVEAIPAGANHTLSIEWVPRYEGPSRIRFLVDHTQRVEEANEGNNEITKDVAVLGKPDLEVLKLLIEPEDPVLGEMLRIRVLVGNTDGSQTGSCKGTFLADGDTISTVTIPGLAPKAECWVECSWSPPGVGRNHIEFLVDTEDSVDEEDENNNRAGDYVDVGTGELPDLLAVSIELEPEAPTTGRAVTLRPVIGNIGAAESGECKVAFYVENLEIGTAKLPRIPPGRYLSEIAEVALSWVPASTGYQMISIRADHEEIVAEENETNNEARTTVSVLESDLDPPDLGVFHMPIRLFDSTITERDNVTFRATASDPSGVAWIKIFVNGMMVHTCPNETTCDYRGGRYPRRSTVTYCAQAADKAGNIALTPWQNFTVRSYYPEFLRLEITPNPVAPTQVDRVNFTAIASYPYGIQVLRIYRNGIKVGEVENGTIITSQGGPWPADTRVTYYAEAYSIDGHYGRTPDRSFTVQALARRNSRNASSYAPREVFLVSDLDWRTVLSFVPISVWREDDGTVMDYPVLIYHKENRTAFDVDSAIWFLNQYSEGMTNPRDLQVTALDDLPPDLARLLVAAPPVGAGLSTSQVEVWRPTSTSLVGTIIDFGTGPGLVPDIPPIDTGTLREGLHAKWGVLADLSRDGSSGIVPMDDILTVEEEEALRRRYWTEINLYILCEDRYSTGLMASVFASYFNAPIIFQGHYDISELDHKNVYLIGEFSEDEVSTLRAGNVNILYRFSKEEVERHYVLASRTNKVVLVNPLDLWTHRRTEYRTDKATHPISFTYGKHSLAAPFLAAAKQEVILTVSTYNYVEIDQYLERRMAELPFPGMTQYLTIVASPEGIPIARPNFGYPMGLTDSMVVYHGFNFGDADIVSNNHHGSAETYLTLDSKQQYMPACSDEIIAWVDEAGYGDIWYRDLDTGTDHQLTSHRAAQVRPAVYEDRIVWQDLMHTYVVGTETRHQWEIYYKEVGSSRKRITSSNANQERPAIWRDTIVWQDARHGNWSIYKYDLRDDTEERITFDSHCQEAPSVSMNKIVYTDNRNGHWDIYMTWLGIGGKGAAGERRITDDPGAQRFPRIHLNHIVWMDNRNGNWDVYMYDIDSETERRITHGAIDHVWPVIWGDRIAWYERDADGWWYICLYDIPTGRSERIVRTAVSADDGAWWLEVDGRYYGSHHNLEHQDMPTGRIYGVTVTDAASYIARDLFFDRLPREREALVVVREDHQPEIGAGWRDELVLQAHARTKYWTSDVRAQFPTAHFYSGHGEVGAQSGTIHNLYNSCDLIIYVDHGWTEGLCDMMESGWLIERQVYLKPATILDLACLTGSYNAQANKPRLLAAQNIRRGAMAHMGATDVSYWHNMFDDILRAVYVEGKTLGQAYLEARNEDYDEDIWNFSLTLKGDIFYALLGDPTFVPRWW